MAGNTTSTELLSCDVEGCDYETNSPQGFGGHRWRAHGIKSPERERRAALGQRPKNARRTERAEAAKLSSTESEILSSAYLASVRSTLADLTSPLREQRDQIQRRLDELEFEARGLRETRSQINAVLTKLDPGAVPKRSPKQAEAVSDSNADRARRQLDAKVEAVAAIIANEPDRFSEGFTANLLADKLKDEVPRGLSTKSSAAVIEELRERGLLRADKVTRGGGMQFRLVTSNGAEANGN